MKKIAVIVLLVLILGAIIWYGGTKAFNHSHTSLSEDKVSQMMIEKYGGTIKNISPDQGNYKLTLAKDQILYDIIVNRRTGNVVSFTKQSSPVTNNSRQSEIKEPQKSNPTTSVDTLITIDKAEELALENVSGTITSIKLDEEDDQLVYKVDIVQTKIKKKEVVINAYSGKIESIIPKKSKPTTSVDTPITIDKAEELALEKVSGTITSIKLDEDGDQLVYEVDIDQSKTKKAEVIINAYSGKVESITFEKDKHD